MERMSLAAAAKRFSDEAAAWEYVEQIRWHGKPFCPRCGSEDVLYLQPRSEAPRMTRTGAATYRRVWRCRACKRQFSCLIGTIFEGSKIPLRKWVMGIYLMCAAKNGCSAMELQRDLEITYKSAWYLVHRIREAMAHSPNGKMRGIIQADETWVGGAPENRHSRGRKAQGTGPNKTEKATVFTIVNKLTGETRSEVVPNVRAHHLARVIDANVEKYGSVLHTDSAMAYRRIGTKFSRHEYVDHSADEYVGRTGATINHVEGFFSQFKRSLDGTYHSVSREHLGRYAKEFDFRASTRQVADGDRAMQVFDRAVGSYISYQDLIAAGPVAQKSRPKPPGRPGRRTTKPPSLRLATGVAT